MLEFSRSVCLKVIRPDFRHTKPVCQLRVLAAQEIWSLRPLPALEDLKSMLLTGFVLLILLDHVRTSIHANALKTDIDGLLLDIVNLDGVV